MAGGLGTRMKSATPKHLHPLLGRRMVDWVIGAARARGADRVVVVASPDTAALFDGVEVAVQQAPLGTGDAVRSARAALAGEEGDILVLNGDVPALTPELLRALVETHRSAGAAGDGALVRAGRRPLLRPHRPGRATAGSRAIVEAGDATPEELALREVNSGIYVFRAERLWPVLERLEPQNAQGELYVTDTLGLLVGDGEPVAVHTAPVPFEVEGINTRVELAAVSGRAARPHQRAAHARRRDDRRPGVDLDRGRGRDRGGRDDPSVHGAARHDEDRDRRRGRAARRRDRRRDRRRRDGRALRLRPAGHRARRRTPRSARSSS